MRKVNFITVKSSFVYIILFALIIFSASHSKTYITAGKDALLLCFNIIIPSLFPFFVFSQLLIQTGFAEHLKRLTSFVFRPIFNINGSGALAFIIGILSGYPAGASVCLELYEKKLITLNEARRLIPFCNNSGPLFIIGAVGCGMFGNTNIGILLYIVHIASALLTGFCFRFYNKSKKEYTKITYNKNTGSVFSFGKVFSESVEHSIRSILNVCGFIVIFSCLLSALTPIIDSLIENSVINLLTNGIFEITLGIRKIASSDLSYSLRLILTSFLLGFGGICVFLQVAGIISKTDIGIKTYIIGKTIQASFSAVLCSLLLKTGTLPVSVQNEGANFYTFLPSKYLVIFSVIFIFSCFCLKKRKLF